MGTVVAAVAALSACTGTSPNASDRTTSTSSPTASLTPAAPTPAVTTGVVQGSDGWSTYTNAEYQFSIRFPTRIYGSSGSPCVKKQSDEGWDYQSSPGVVPASIRRHLSEFTITQRYGYLPRVSGYAPDGSSLFQSCPRVTITPTMFGTEDLPPVAVLGFMVKSQFTRAHVERWVRRGYDSCGRRMKVTFAPSTHGDWTDVAFTCPAHPTVIDAAPAMRWYESADLYVAFSFGFLADVKNVARRNVEGAIADSFSPL